MIQLLTEKKMIQILFEKFNVPSLSIFISSFLSLYAAKRETGIVCDIGDGVSQVLPVYEGKIISDCAVRNDLGGRDFINWFQRGSKKNGSNLKHLKKKK